MNTRTMTPEQIRSEGLDALRQRLGVAGTIRFLQLFEVGRLFCVTLGFPPSALCFPLTHLLKPSRVRTQPCWRPAAIESA